jgi:vesicle-associated membrane protein 7
MTDSYSNIDKVKEVQSEVEQIKNVMGKNIEKIMKRGEKVEVLLDKSEQLSHESTIFRRKSKSLKRQICFKNIKMIGLISLLVAFIIIIIIISTH